MLKVLEPVIPVDRAAQQVFFEPDLLQLSKKDAEMFKRRGSDLRRTLVDHAGISPIGLLRWCLQQPHEKKPSAGGVFLATHERFDSVPDSSYKLVCRINNFRNDYIAHQVKELSDPTIAKTGMIEWIAGLVAIWGLHRQSAALP